MFCSYCVAALSVAILQCVKRFEIIVSVFPYKIYCICDNLTFSEAFKICRQTFGTFGTMGTIKKIK